MPTALTEGATPYADALRDWAARDIERLLVPGHGAQDAVPELTAFFGRDLLRLDIPPMVPGIDIGPGSPFAQAQALAARAWGARRTWFLANGSSQANRIAALALGFYRGPGQPVVVQRSIHSSFNDGIILAGLDARFVSPSIDQRLGIAHGISPAALRKALADCPDAKAVYVVSPSFFGAAADIAALADVAHEAGVPLVVDAAWAAHFGFHPALPPGAVRDGADLVIMSTHKLGGSLTQTAVLHLGPGPYASDLDPLVQRAYMMEQSTSENAWLLASIDLARAALEQAGPRIEASISFADELRARVRAAGRFAVASDSFAAFDDIAAVDPLRFSVDVSAGGLIGHAVRDVLLRDAGVYFEVSTAACVVGIVPPGVRPDVGRIIGALHALAPDDLAVAGEQVHRPLPGPGPRTMLARDAAFAPSEVVPARDAVGRVSADTLAAYPPGIPNLMPGEVITGEVVEFLRQTAAAPSGLVRGALDPSVSALRVVSRPTA